eukprot:5256969-Alexandrium_andersonii.AAC.1
MPACEPGLAPPRHVERLLEVQHQRRLAAPEGALQLVARAAALPAAGPPEARGPRRPASSRLRSRALLRLLRALQRGLRP